MSLSDILRATCEKFILTFELERRLLAKETIADLRSGDPEKVERGLEQVDFYRLVVAEKFSTTGYYAMRSDGIPFTSERCCKQLAIVASPDDTNSRRPSGESPISAADYLSRIRRLLKIVRRNRGSS